MQIYLSFLEEIFIMSHVFWYLLYKNKFIHSKSRPNVTMKTYRGEDFSFVVYRQILFGFKSPNGDKIWTNREKLQNR